jgi:hypothetical protein
MKYLLILLFIITVTSGYNFGQGINNDRSQDNNRDKVPGLLTEKSYKSIIKIELAQGGLQFEHKNKKKNSLHLSLQYSYSSFFNKDDYNVQITPEFRFYLSNRRAWPYGFYLANYLFYKDYIVARDMKSNGNLIYSKDLVKTSGLGLKAGYQSYLANRITVDFGMGLGYNIFRDVKHELGVLIIEESTHYLNFTGALSFGYTF